MSRPLAPAGEASTSGVGGTGRARTDASSYPGARFSSMTRERAFGNFASVPRARIRFRMLQEFHLPELHPDQLPTWQTLMGLDDLAEG